MVNKRSDQIRLDLEIITDLVEPGSRVLDLGCGEGDLLRKLMDEKGCHGQGIEILDENVCAAVQKGVPVIHADLDGGLCGYPDRSFDYVILSRTLQVVKRPDLLLRDMLRVGQIGLVSFPNFGALQVKSQLFFKGQMPVTKNLPYQWCDTPNIHLLTIRDFQKFCEKERIRISQQIHLGAKRKRNRLANLAPGLFAHLSIYKIQKETQD